MFAHFIGSTAFSLCTKSNALCYNEIFLCIQLCLSLTCVTPALIQYL